MYPIVQNQKTLIFILWISQVVFVFGQQAYVSGNVSNGEEGLPNSKVSLGEMTLTTDSDGNYSLSIKPGRYVITVTHEGYRPIDQVVTLLPGDSQALNFVMNPNYQLGEVVVSASRSKVERSNLSTAVPVDAFSQKMLQQTGQVSLTQMLNFLAPSINVSRETLNEPVALRGLDPDHVLILINGIRYHNMAWINSGNLKGQLGRGSVGNDLNSIPPSSIERIEVLRDGASAQYGSDAIAGVINIILKEWRHHTKVDWHQGQFYKGDGEKYALGVSHGMSLNKTEDKGFLNISGDFRRQAATHRGGQYDGTVYYEIPEGLSQQEKDSLLLLDDQAVAGQGFNRKTAVDQVGNSKITVAGLLANGAYPVNNHLEVFWTTAYNRRKVYREQLYRFPKNKSRVNLELYPNGFQPLSETTTTDVSFIAGGRGKLSNDWNWDLTTSLGSNSLRSDIRNTNNASQSYLGQSAPTSFYNGKRIYQQLTNNLNFSKKVTSSKNAVNLYNLSTGLEWRLEHYYETPGEEASWKNYDDTYRKLPGTGGMSPDDVINKGRNNIGVFVDFDTEFQRNLLLNFAGRYEFYSDFGGNLAGKLAARYRFTNRFSLRTSLSNGFRAPSLQQRYTISVSETKQNMGGVLVASVRGIFPNDHAVVKALGVPSLTAEKSISVSGGFVADISKNLSLTADAYWLQLKDRIVLSGMFYRNNNPGLNGLLDQYPEFNQIDQIAFFSNAINTHTKGLDVVFQGVFPRATSQLRFLLAANFTQTRLYGDVKIAENLSDDLINANSLLNIEEKEKIEKGQPESKIIFTINYTKGKMGFILSNTRFGRTSIAPLVDANSGLFLREQFSAKIITDLSFNYTLKETISISVGANNLFNVYPDRIKNYENTSQGMHIYSPEVTSFGFNGGYYFISTSFGF